MGELCIVTVSERANNVNNSSGRIRQWTLMLLLKHGDLGQQQQQPVCVLWQCGNGDVSYLMFLASASCSFYCITTASFSWVLVL